ncbi:MAG: bifunctional proline dehydrogenase/L-glutamate gamma-semialdehyde dehydrogenase PutA [Devosiaceae bacterium]|nr:bifunctional proline dehydrogenase/L-glutamate gamma-semialdehyde dehydrogenase PutA [Devosiaceae bacterium MH13]
MLGIDPKWDRNKRRDEASLLADLVATANLSPEARDTISRRAAELVTRIRGSAQPGLMEAFLAEYGLSTDEGVALMCLAEALLRVPDQPTIDALIEDKIAASDWSHHLGQASSPLVNASTWGLMLTGKVLDEPEDGIAGTLRTLVRKLGEPVIRTATGVAMREMGRQFVLGQTIDAAMERAAKQEAKGFTYSYDMLGEGALTAQDAQRYADNYARAIDAIANACTHDSVAANPGISVKLSALHPRYEVAQTERLLDELVPVLADLAAKAAAANMGFNIDAEEADRLCLSLTLIEAVLKDQRLASWDGFGVVVQAYSKRAGDLITGLDAMAERHNRRLMVRLVKGAYWDTEIKHAQVQGLAGSPVFTRKVATDVSYLAHARRLLGLTDRLYPQFATHNAHTMAGVLHMAEGLSTDAYEFQRLHGMGETLHTLVKDDAKTRCRIYAPVGAHRDLLAYLVRRLLENGANSSFVNQIVDESVPPEQVAACPFEALAKPQSSTEPTVVDGPDLFAPDRRNALGFDLSDVTQLAEIVEQRRRPVGLEVEPILVKPPTGKETDAITNPADGSRLGTVRLASIADVASALDHAEPWAASARERATILNSAADLFEDAYGEIFSLLACEAGKTLLDCVGELREAVDFLRYYAARAEELDAPARGIISCISPWNFPLAIFTGQIAAALAAGNAVLAKPAETTPAIAALSVRLLHQAGVPRGALQLLHGHGATVGAALTSDPRVAGVAFTGSTATAQRVETAMAKHCAPGTPLIAETGGLNAMIVDSTALPEQAVRDIVSSAFQSAGQRCSALRCLYVQEDIADTIKTMLMGAMDELALGDPWHLATDCGPVITAEAQASIADYIDAARQEGRLLHALAAPKGGNFVGPALIEIGGIEDLEREVFGPGLHIATYAARDLSKVISAINATGYGLTFGMHSRIDDRVQAVAESVDVGNVYINRNQIGAIVGSQPFGGHGLSGTGPKAGGPNYVQRFTRRAAPAVSERWETTADVSAVEAALRAAAETVRPTRSVELPGPTGELNAFSMQARAPVLCLGPGPSAAAQQVDAITKLGGVAVAVDGALPADALTTLSPLGGALWWGDAHETKRLEDRCYAVALADRDGPIVPLICDLPDRAHAQLERHLSVDTTAAGGNVSLLSGST